MALDTRSKQAFRVLAALDVKGGIVVRAGGGDRSRYPPLRSPLAGLSPEPIDVARALRRELGIASLYVADLDAIAGGPPRGEILRTLIDDDFRLLVDAGCRGGRDAEALAAIGPLDVVAAVETLAGPERLAEVLGAVGPDRAVFGIDLRGGVILEGRPGWPGGPLDAARAARELGTRRMLVLDLALVGSGAGPPARTVGEIVGALPGVEVLAGGGVRSVEDLVRLRSLGAAGAVVGTAMYEGVVTRSEIESL